jgi:AcrR family transcriptional regulator
MVRNLLRRFTRSYADRLLTERPELTVRQAELIAWGIQSVMAGPGRSARLSTADMGGVVLGAALALCDAPMTAPDPDAPARPESRLQPVSRRERLLLGAMRLFAERGYQDTAMADIGAVADVTGPSLYAHFESKAALLLAGIERGVHLLWAGLDEALRDHAEPQDALCAVVAGYVRRSRDWSGIALPLGGETAIEEAARGLQREYVAEWVGLLQQGRPALDPAVARVSVRIALSLIDDLCRTPHLIDDAFGANVAAMALAVLTSRAAPA